MHKLGYTRSTSQRGHLLHTPDTFVRTVLPGMEHATAVVHISPAGGAAFTQYSADLEPGGNLGITSNQRFIYVLEGAADLATETIFHPLTTGSYAYLPEDCPHTLTAQQTTRLAVIEKPYESLGSTASPDVLVGHEDKVLSVPLNDDPDLQVRNLLPNSSSFDFAVNTMTYQPGAALSMVEVHVMEHGLLMLEGGGIYRLGEQWHPVAAGDFIWMGPYCPQWFGAIGKRPAKYLIYKDWNRNPLV
ncbi:(S)-ureidoglycine aminohydrolase [Granulicella sp. L60]|uniref:(S)-ureidoglycine aminohydrolase n=1 Tax=Granulicella sp. L60 TaxID=1641866 RepID=UPI00131C25D6|nr:(S)-ureidoglycine aminohydrolase [Granulicella sp. L60]